MIRTDLTGDTPATMRLAWRIDQKAHAALEEETFGKRILPNADVVIHQIEDRKLLDLRK